MLMTKIFGIPSLAIERQNTGISIVENWDNHFKIRYNGAGSRGYEISVDAFSNDYGLCRIIIRKGDNYIVNGIHKIVDCATIIERECGILIG